LSNFGKELLDIQGVLAKERAPWESLWAEVSPLVLPRQDSFFGKNSTSGMKRSTEKVDDTAPLALERGSAGIEGILIPRKQLWHGIVPDMDREATFEELEWGERVRDFMFKHRYRASANFASQAHEMIMSLLAFGTGVMSIEDSVGEGIKYRNCHISEHYIMENQYGSVDTDYRMYKLTARQAVEKFKENTPETVAKIAEKTPTEKIEFLHVVMPDKNRDTNYKFASYHLLAETGEMIHVGGFKSFPYVISRWVTAPNEVYGRSPAMTVLSEIKMLNQIRKTDLRARHNAVAPPHLATDRQSLSKVSLKSNSIIYGAISPDGKQLLRPYNFGARIDVSNQTIEQSRTVINDAFFVTLFQILVNTPQMTATEVLSRDQEKGTLLSPSAGRQNNEWLEPQIHRELDIFTEYGVFEEGAILEMPESIRDDGGIVSVDFSNPLSLMQKSNEALGAEKTIQSLLPISQIDPTILDNVDWAKYAEILRKANGAPVGLFKSPDVIEAEQAQKKEMSDMQGLAQMAPQMAGAVKDIAQAQSFTEGK